MRAVGLAAVFRAGLAEHELIALGCGDHVQAARALASLTGERVHAGVFAVRIVVEEHEPFHVRDARHVDRVLDRAVTPARLCRVIGRVVLSVVDHEVRVAKE